MTFDKILEDGRLWAVQYDDCPTNALKAVFDQWENILWLRDFFTENIDDLSNGSK